jgi:hypothetical protein
MPDRANYIENIIESIKETKNIDIDLIITNNTNSRPNSVAEKYIKYAMPNKMKFESLSIIVEEKYDKNYYNYLIIIDDDVLLKKNFFDDYFFIVNNLKIVLSQPALTFESLGSHECTRRIERAIVHSTAFIEIGPVTCFENKILPYIDFNEGSPMGWGLDYIWSKVCIDRNWTMGVVDYTPITHNLRKVGSGYKKIIEQKKMETFLSKKDSVPSFVCELIGQIIWESQIDMNIKSDK